MTEKTLLFIAIGDSSGCDELTHHATEWEICKATSLADAEHLLRTRHIVVGVIALDFEYRELAGVNAFLHMHWDVQWIALCHSLAMQQQSFRQLVHEHCCDFHTWPVDGFRLKHTLGHARGVAALRNYAPLSVVTALPLVGQGKEISRLRQQIMRVAAASAPVLVRGESGTGKELVARAIHDHSLRAAGPFVAINCAAISATLVQSELFGYERGAFTGALRDKRGLLESANGGTIFLDEIGDLPLELQSMLLRFLQDKMIVRLGATRGVEISARVIAATHVNMEEAVSNGRFREDLYYRLNVLSLEVPALRARKEDLSLLAEHFFHKFAAERAPRLKGFSTAALNALAAHHWPGNVRELINRIRRAMVMAEGRLIQPVDLMLNGAAGEGAEPLDGVRVRAERHAIEASLSEGKSITLVAQELGVSRMTLYRLMAKHGIPSPANRRSK